MIDISVKDLVKSYEVGSNVLDGLSFDVNTGEHIGILGPNGCGKTTLFKILTGSLDYDEGQVSVARGKRIGLISQIPRFPDGWTTEDVLKSAHQHLYNIQERMQELEQQMEQDSSPALLNEYDRLMEQFNTMDGYQIDAIRNRVANGLEITETMRRQTFDSLSGGEKTRVNLARLILEDTDILLLDEPTNHLDMQSIEWLEDYVNHFHGTVLTISHDRYYLDVVCQRCIEISSGKAEFYSGNYSFYVVERQKRYEEKLRQYEKDQEKIEQLQRAAEQMHLWAFLGNDKLHKRAFSMEKRIQRMKERGVEKPVAAKKLNTRFQEMEFLADDMLTIDGVTKNYEGRTLFSPLDMKVQGKERIAVIGNNGTGKSTLVRMIMNELAPDTGTILLSANAKVGYLPQIVTFEDPSRSCLDTMLYEAGCKPQEARDRLAAFGFRGEKVFTPVNSLSGGEQSRLKLCIEMGKNINLLVLDEPTNHLDIDSREWIEDAIEDYNEALIFVSHDRYFIERFANRIWAFSMDGTVLDYQGTYPEYRSYLARQIVFRNNEAEKKKTGAKTESKPKKRSPNSKTAAKIEREIARKEERMAQLTKDEETFSTDYEKLMELSEEKTQLDQELLELYEQCEQSV